MRVGLFLITSHKTPYDVAYVAFLSFHRHLNCTYVSPQQCLICYFMFKTVIMFCIGFVVWHPSYRLFIQLPTYNVRCSPSVSLLCGFTFRKQDLFIFYIWQQMPEEVPEEYGGWDSSMHKEECVFETDKGEIWAALMAIHNGSCHVLGLGTTWITSLSKGTTSIYPASLPASVAQRLGHSICILQSSICSPECVASIFSPHL